MVGGEERGSTVRLVGQLEARYELALEAAPLLLPWYASNPVLNAIDDLGGAAVGKACARATGKRDVHWNRRMKRALKP